MIIKKWYVVYMMEQISAAMIGETYWEVIDINPIVWAMKDPNERKIVFAQEFTEEIDE